VTWSALVPLKLGPERKSRLAARLSAAERAHLSDTMAAHVLATLKPCVTRVEVLAPVRVGDWQWREDLGRGLNAELIAARAEIAGPLLVVFADLPLLTSDDVRALLAAAERAGVAIAPDRAGEGTNAIALADARSFRFAFGEGSFARHRAEAPGAEIVLRQGLALDVDTPGDLDAATAKK
jgi:2-phospho-L-lactate guanylyltransferase